MKSSKGNSSIWVTLGILALLGLLAGWLYLNRQRFYPEVREITFLQINLADTLTVNAGIQVQNKAPFSFQIDSLRYAIRYKGQKIGWGRRGVPETFPALSNHTFNLQLFLDKDRYKTILKKHQNQDSLQLDVQVQLYLDPPLLGQQILALNRPLTMAIAKSPMVEIDSFFVKSFSPEAGYVFQLNLNTRNVDLPSLQLENLQYSIKLSDSLTINGKIDTVLSLKSHAPLLEIPVHLQTAEMIDAIKLKLAAQKIWPYLAQASGTLKTGHPLLEDTRLQVSRSGTLDTRKIGGTNSNLPSIKKINKLEVIAREKATFLEAEVQIYNPSQVPLYVDSARYRVRSGGKLVANGGNDHEKVLIAKENEVLKLNLAFDKRQYEKLLNQPRKGNSIPLNIELLLLFNLKNSPPKQLTIRKNISMPVTESPSFELKDIGVKSLEPDQDAQLFVKLEVKNKSQVPVSLDDLHYQIQLQNGIDIGGKTQKPILIDSGTTQVEVPVVLSGAHVNQLARGLIQGVEQWPYSFTGTALVSTPNSLLHRTEITFKTADVFSINSKGTPDYMPEISKIDTVNLSIRYDTAWAHMYAAIYNTLPATIRLTQLQVDAIFENDTVAKSEEKLNLDLAPNANSFAWHTLGVNYGLWEKRVLEQQGQDSMLLYFPTRLFFQLGNLEKQEAELELKTRIPTPASPVFLLQKVKIKGFSFRHGLKFDALVAIQNANSPGLAVKNITYNIVLENGVDLCGTVNREYKIPLGISEVKVPISLSVWESLKMLKRQFLGPPLLDYKINGTGELRTDNPKLSHVFVIFENHNQTNLREKKTLRPAK